MGAILQLSLRMVRVFVSGIPGAAMRSAFNARADPDEECFLHRGE
jgi:hypothetical protein